MMGWYGRGAMLAALMAGAAQAETLTLVSPDGEVSVTVADHDDGPPTYAVAYRGQPVLAPSPLGLELDKGGVLGRGLRVAASARTTVDQTYALVAGKTRQARDHHNQLTLDLAEPGPGGRRLQLIVRAYDDGAAFRYRLPAQASLEAVALTGELTRFDFPADYRCWGLNLGQFGSSHEGEYDPVQASKLRPQNLYEAPLVCDTGRGATFALAEADLRNYAGLYLGGRGDGGLGVTVRLSPRLDDPEVAVRTRIGSDLLSSWRVVMLGTSAGRLIESDLITSLNPPAALADTAWIKPGKAAWDWWNGAVVPGIDKPAMTDPTLKGFIDFAHDARLDYMLIDDGWYVGGGGAGTVRPGTDITRPIPQIDMPGLVAYGAQRGVGLWVWAHWKPMDAQMDEALALYERWGLKGIKVDFMDRDDQAMVEFYHRLLTKAGEHHLMVDLHGASHPTGLARTYPHYLTQEGVMGAEYNKWSRRVTATHNVTLAYTRMLLGPMDYTPGGFRNVTPAAFEPRFVLPVVQTTRGQALAMYVVYDSPLGLVSDSPVTYAASPAGLDFISTAPTSWDETRFLAGEIGQFVVLARRHGGDWYVGAMTNEAGRTVRIPLGFLGPGAFDGKLYEDGAGPTDLRVSDRPLDAGAALTLKLAPSGGAAVVLRRRG